LDVLIPTPEVKNLPDLKTVPEEDKEQFSTLSGMLMWPLGRVPHTGDTQWEQWRFEVVDLEGKRVDKVLTSRLTELDHSIRLGLLTRALRPPMAFAGGSGPLAAPERRVSERSECPVSRTAAASAWPSVGQHQHARPAARWRSQSRQPPSR